MVFKKGDIVKLKPDYAIIELTKEKEYVVVGTTYNTNVKIVNDNEEVYEYPHYCFTKATEEPDKVLFISASRDITSKKDADQLYDLSKALMNAFPKHRVIFVPESIEQIQKHGTEGLTVLYKKPEKPDKPLEIIQPIETNPGDARPWWEYMPITVSTTELDLDKIDIIGYGTYGYYQTNIFDHMKNQS